MNHSKRRRPHTRRFTHALDAEIDARNRTAHKWGSDGLGEQFASLSFTPYT
jgi:hypothetical protein